MGLMRLIGLIGRMGLMGQMRLMGAYRRCHYLLFVIYYLLFIPASASAQVIGGHVYGGGNQGNVAGKTKVHVVGGDIDRVFGGARMANVGGRTFVHIDGANAATDSTILINQVYGGNDISGAIGSSAEALPTELEHVKRIPADDDDPEKNDVDETWNSLVRVTSTNTAPEEGLADHKTTKDAVFIGTLYAAGNGNYDYVAPDESDARHRIYENGQLIAFNNTGFSRPTLDKTYLEVLGGSIGNAFGGGNNATVNKKTVIYVENRSAVVSSVKYKGFEKLNDARTELMGYNKGFTNANAVEFQVGMFFGGNNRAEMTIRPTWNLQAGLIRNLFSGGNKGSMTSPEGLLLDINPTVTNAPDLVVDNVYGGCRMGDVKPTVNGIYTPTTNLPGYSFPNELSARVLVRRGDINNVYGGNDITGTVYGGNAVGIHTSIRGDVYGGGNGGYLYTDVKKDDPIYGDFYFETDEDHPTTTSALNAYRPNAEQVSIRLVGESPTNPTIIYGSVFLGGDCATLATKKEKPMVELKIGSHVIADNVFLGNNGQKMVADDILELYANDEYSSLNLTDPSVFSTYMEGVCMNLQPSVVFMSEANGDGDTYIPYSSYIGSFYCGGNRGSMGIAGKNIYSIDKGLNIYNKFVGGCNDAYVAPGTYNAAYLGGVIGVSGEREDFTEGGKIKDRLEINLSNLTITPLRWNKNQTRLIWNTQKWGNAYHEMAVGTELTAGDKYYTYTDDVYVENTVPSGGITVGVSDEFYKKIVDFYKGIAVGVVLAEGTKYYTCTPGYYTEQTAAANHTIDEDDHFFEKGVGFEEVANSAVDSDTRLLEGNVYGGCYDSGIVNGNIIININEGVLKKDQIFGEKANPSDRYPSGVLLEDQRNDLMAVALSAFGGGCGEDTEVWGSTTVNLNKGYIFQIFGGGEAGLVGKKERNADGTPKLDGEGNYVYEFDPAYSTTVNLNGSTPIYSSTDTDADLAETEYIYAGGNEGDICGNTYANLGNGRIYDAFGGSSDADILGHTEVIIGRQPDGSGGYKRGFPWIRDIVYGGNDFGGTIWGEYEPGFDYTARVQNYETVKEQLHGYAEGKHEYMLQSSSYVEYLEGRVDSIFGGGYGYYKYSDTGLYGEGCKMPRQESSFVNVRPIANDRNSLSVVFGAGTGFPANREGDEAQDHSYVLIDIPAGVERFSDMEVFGSGSYNGVGMRLPMATTFTPGFDQDKVSAVVDLLHGEVGNVYGGSFREGNTCRTVINVPEESNIKLKNIFGGAYGLQILPPCDVILSNVNYHNTNEEAVVTGAIYGGNNNQRRTIFTHVDITAPVWSNKAKGYLAKVYGAGKGFNSWSEHTLVNLRSGAKVYEAYGGGEMGHVLNAETVQHYMLHEKDKPSTNISEEAPWNEAARWIGDVGGTLNPVYKTEWDKAWIDAWTLGHYYTPKTESPSTDFKNYFDTFAALRTSSLVYKAEIDERDYTGYSDTERLKRQFINNTNVIINEGAEVVNYAYGGGLGDVDVPLSGDVWGSTYIALLGGTVKKDIYAAGTAGAVSDAFGHSGAYNETTNPFGFTATATAYIKGGTCRNVYGGGWRGHVGIHNGELYESNTGDLPGETYVVIGVQDATDFTNGVPAVTRNVYGGGEGGSVYGNSHVTLNNGYIGYRYENTGTELAPIYKYVEELDDREPGDLDLSGNVFGGGYVINSYVDNAHVSMYGGTVRGSLYGGGEIGPIGRGTLRYASTDPWDDTGLLNGNARIYKAGQTHVKMFNGHVMRNVFGGGRGFDNFSGDGTMYMDKDLVARLDLKIKGFVFGQTDVNIYGGEIGTNEGVASNYGNVFGAGDEGFVYSAYELADGSLACGKSSGARYDDGDEGYYYKYEKNGGGVYGYKLEGGQKALTEDCRVLVEPWLQVKYPISYDDHTYDSGDYIPTDYLNTLPKKDKDSPTWPAEWNAVDAGSLVGDEYVERGVIIHNAVFAGGNIAVGSNLNANTKTVFGNATATIHDVYNRDLISIGGMHIGGLYGDGNLTLVDGYRELNVTNYGTDYYNIKDQISFDAYQQLPPREKAYYELKYKCVQACEDNDHTHYTPGAEVPQDELFILFEGNTTIIRPDGTPNPAYWTENGVVSRYAGRYLNTLQRADFCGVFGSRLVMKGAKDRVPEVLDNTNYTINRVREVSLNKKESIASDAAMYDGKFATHGNYFGIYSVVNHLGALTSDLDFYNAVRTTDNKDEAKYKTPTANGKPYLTATYADWKEQFHKDPRRNNGLSHNEVALASGVYLELTTEESTGTTLDTKDWGIITGVVQLDLINVAKGVGGGFVYAKNIHGVREGTGKTNSLLSDLNKTGGPGDTPAVTNKIWKYIETDPGASATQKEWQTSGNFIHNSEIIIDDCYNISGRYQMGNRVPAHYWYIRGSVYVYDQYITAHTGSPTAYSQSVELPITITAASRSKMLLMDVQPNLYAYYSSYTSSTNNTKLGDEQKVVINENEYYLNTPISYWDWSQLPTTEKRLFVDETFVTSDACKIGETIYPAGLVLLPSEYDARWDAAPTREINGEEVKAVLKIVKDEYDNDVVATDKSGNPIYVPFTSVFHSSNEMAHDTGYQLTYKMTNPGLWDTWYTEAASTSHNKAQDKKDVSGWDNGPTYYLNPTMLSGAAGKLLGQHTYEVADIIPQEVYTKYEALGVNKPDPATQASFAPAYLVTQECSTSVRHYYEGAAVAGSEAAALVAASSAEAAYVCTGSIQLSPTEYIFVNDVMTLSEKNALKTAYPSLATDIEQLVVPAYYCTKAGPYGGSYYLSGQNYRGLEAWSSMSETDREYFTFNYDAFDLLIDPTYGQDEGKKYQYDSAAATKAGAEANPAHYSLVTPIDYTATRDGAALKLVNGQTIKVTRGETKDKVITGDSSESTTVDNSIQNGDELTREAYESLLNEQYHYAPIDVTSENKTSPFYVANESFYYNEPFAAGQVIDAVTYEALPGDIKTSKVDEFNFSTATNGIYYYCRDSYTIDNTNGTAVVDINSGSHAKNSTVNVGTILNATEYGKLKNQQLGFTIHGVSPTETSTLYVSRNADFDDLSKEKIITVIYQYDYEESDESGSHITPISERHVVRIHITFENGVPTVEDIREPDIVLPGTSVSMRVPTVVSNGFEIIGGGWELFESQEDAESHFSGREYTPSSEPLYWYQDDYYIAYYAKTFNRGKTYSNSVPVHVANYHDLKEVMDDKEYHLHVDYDRTRLKRDSKIYINDYSGSSQNGLDLLKDFYDLSLVSTSGSGYTVTDGVITSAVAPGNTHLADHALLNISETTGTNIYDGDTYKRGVKGGTNLQFFFRSDVEHAGSWTPIGTDDQCFEGTIHGDGHTVSGLNNSLFYNLCGNVYNLGVTGSYNTAGVVDKGSGYVESCWTKTSNESALGSKPNAVFGAPTDATGYQVVNSYFYEGNKNLYGNVDTNPTTGAITSGGARGKATAKVEKAFYDGELAYDLNNFYLYKRYGDQKFTSGSEEQKYSYYTIDDMDDLVLQANHYYASNPDLCSSGAGPAGHVEQYVESRFADGDFRYAAGEIPETENERYHEETEGFYPIWPDDYIFFGQKLTYGYASGHQDVPTAVARDDGRLALNSTANRVYRAPAYYRNSTMSVAHFNPTAYLAQKSSDGTKIAYPGMTAIDFAGHQEGHTKSAYKLGLQDGWFYSPLLDDDGLISISNCDETENLLVYAPAPAPATEGAYANEQTHGVLTAYFTDPAYEDYYDNSEGYRIVGECTDNVYGHIVQDNLVATNDHLLIDKEEFYCPLAYDFDESHRMWYQRHSGNNEFVDHTSGWQGISIPFTAELVTTHQKGEITHFFSGSETSKNSDKKIGHEYWLREFNSINVPEGDVATAYLKYPNAAGSDPKVVTNTFFWDYYYENEPVHNRKDENADQYQQYYHHTRSYASYPLLTAGTPYILGLPGATYYEFDLSGTFVAQNTAAAISPLAKQIVTFASKPQTTIHVSSDDLVKVEHTGEGATKDFTYAFKPNFLRTNLTPTSDYALNADGDKFNQVVSDVTVLPFRPYFTGSYSAKSGVKRDLPHYVVFSGVDGGRGEDGPESALSGDVEIYSKGQAIVAKSHLHEATTIRILHVSGVTIANFVLEPGQTIETPVPAHGTYLVNKKKIFVR